ncbi:hypothetical protein [Actinokineospora sp. NBRC 105648]|uniref:hypothetical protein n=1 Tax=Actinokineospora sp. NBRC 105648 TaxID=3032206 RepID=UPI0024A423C5|nr:hypothetical protein [Actinokineospora sp. NBRC 105648]GLZ43744.1 hypothetical protein Acsp05_73680 [Actinokineospora sp. NBRC 105648]
MVSRATTRAAGLSPGGPVRVRLEKRTSRLRSLLDTGSIEVATRARRTIWQPSPAHEPAADVAIRSDLLRLTPSHEQDSRIQEISTSRSAAVHVLLLALFENQVREPRAYESAGRTRLPVHNPDTVDWVDFAALPTTDPRSSAPILAANRERQIKRALDRLAEHGRVEVKPHGDYNRFRLLNEAADNPAGSPTYYRPPRRTRNKVLILPVEFFTNCWLDALTDNELITYLALRAAAHANPTRHADGGISLSPKSRRTEFNIERPFELHPMLAHYGLVRTTVTERLRRADGTMMAVTGDESGQVHRFTLNDEALRKPGVETVADALTRYINGSESPSRQSS